MPSKVLLITPPFTQLNTPYPATAYLKGFLNTKNISCFQADLGIEVILRLFSRKVLQAMFAIADINDLSANAERIYKLRNLYISCIDPVIDFLQNINPTLAYQICSDNYLPRASRFNQLDDLEWAFGSMGIRDKARHLATLFLEDIGDFIIETVDPFFGFSRYAERLGTSANSFDKLYTSLNAQSSFIDKIHLELLQEKMNKTEPVLIGLSVPFPGNLYSALKAGQFIKSNYPHVKIVLGGGFANTELRSVTDARVFEFIDFITLDDGETPILNLLDHIEGKRPVELLKRSLTFLDGEVQLCNGSVDPDVRQEAVGTPDYSDFALDSYLSVIEMANPMHRFWSDGRWNKLTMAHGCYWGKCTFCDISLDYIKRYEASTAKILVDRMESIIAQTKQHGFHFVDEAAPPALMGELAREILKRKLTVTWWANIRFEKSFTPDMCQLLAASGCVAVSGGLEVASDRLLKLIDKGVTVEQVTRVADHFTSTGIMVHAYLMYGFPTQTDQETIDALEVVRQLFEAGVLQSGFWHQFAMTAHSPVGITPEKFGVRKISEKTGAFANNDIVHEDLSGFNHSLFSEGLRKSLYNYMHGMCFEFDLQEWFNFEVPPKTIPENYVQEIIDSDFPAAPKDSAKMIWLGELPEISRSGASVYLEIQTKIAQNRFRCDEPTALWLIKQLESISSDGLRFNAFRSAYEAAFKTDFNLFWHGKLITGLRENGLLVI